MPRFAVHELRTSHIETRNAKPALAVFDGNCNDLVPEPTRVSVFGRLDSTRDFLFLLFPS